MTRQEQLSFMRWQKEHTTEPPLAPAVRGSNAAMLCWLWMAAFKTYFSPHSSSNMRRRTQVFSNNFSLTVFHQNGMYFTKKLFPISKTTFLLGLQTILKAFLYLWEWKKNQQKLLLLRLFWQRNDTQFPCQGHRKERQIFPDYGVCQTTF